MALQPPQSDPSRPPATPRWVKVIGAVVVLLILIVIVALVVGGEHGPGRHAASGETQLTQASAEYVRPS